MDLIKDVANELDIDVLCHKVRTFSSFVKHHLDQNVDDLRRGQTYRKLVIHQVKYLVYFTYSQILYGKLDKCLWCLNE